MSIKKFAKTPNTAPLAPSFKAYKQLSDVRKELLISEVERGVFSSGAPEAIKDENSTSTKLGNVIGSGGIKKIASTASSNLGSAWSNSSNTVRQTPEIYSPLLLLSNTFLPRDRTTMNLWCRAFFALNPIVNNALSLHSTYPISKLNISCTNKKVEDFINSMAEEMDLLNVCVQIAQEYWVLGECFPYLEFDENKNRWSRCVIQNPDFIHVRRSAIAGEPEISLKPDSDLINICTKNDPQSAKLRMQLPPDVIKYVRQGKYIPLHNFYISHIARKISPYETRGTSLIASCFKALMLFDKLRECEYVQADSLVNPLTLVKLGGSADAEYKPTTADLENWRTILEEAEADKNYKIITHGSVSIERVTGNAIIDKSATISQLLSEIFAGLQIPSILVNGANGSDLAYSNASLALDALRQRYMQFQNMLAKWIKTKVFAPICEINEFYKVEDGEKKLIIPEIEWNHMNLFDLNDYITTISQLVGGEKKIVSVQTLYRSLGINYNDEQTRLRKEAIDEEIRLKEKESLSKMSLTNLRALGEDSDIPDLPDTPVLGENPDEETNEKEEAGGMGGGLGGGITPPKE